MVAVGRARTYGLHEPAHVDPRIVCLPTDSVALYAVEQPEQVRTTCATERQYEDAAHLSQSGAVLNHSATRSKYKMQKVG